MTDKTPSPTACSPEQLLGGDFSSAGVSEMSTAITRVVTTLTELLAEHAPDGTWQGSPDPAEHMTQAGSMVDQAHRALREARGRLDVVETNARDRQRARRSAHAPAHALLSNHSC
ncbi:hypothetical protein [Streptomyces nanshensis]|uniref:hypothetical protein n=1 Tax=Streptomyces nanshensis TaxID=518642 RepID=UPI00085C803C|nr:hypothetical protein [Streptomyces nanshensis]